jgi:hypothetical protein
MTRPAHETALRRLPLQLLAHVSSGTYTNLRSCLSRVGASSSQTPTMPPSCQAWGVPPLEGLIVSKASGGMKPARLRPEIVVHGRQSIILALPLVETVLASMSIGRTMKLHQSRRYVKVQENSKSGLPVQLLDQSWLAHAHQSHPIQELMLANAYSVADNGHAIL